MDGYVYDVLIFPARSSHASSCCGAMRRPWQDMLHWKYNWLTNSIEMVEAEERRMKERKEAAKAKQAKSESSEEKHHENEAKKHKDDADKKETEATKKEDKK